MSKGIKLLIAAYFVLAAYFIISAFFQIPKAVSDGDPTWAWLADMGATVIWGGMVGYMVSFLICWKKYIKPASKDSVLEVEFEKEYLTALARRLQEDDKATSVTMTLTNIPHNARVVINNETSPIKLPPVARDTDLDIS